MKVIRKIWNTLVVIRTKQDFLHIVVAAEEWVNQLFARVEVESWWKNVGLSSIRALIGGLLFSNVFRQKIGLPDIVSGEIRLPDDLSLPNWLHWLNEDTLQFLEKMDSWAGAGMLVAGFNTRLMALSYLWTSLNESASGNFSPEWSLYYFTGFLMVCMSAIILGSGKFGVDHLIVKWFKNRKKKQNYD